MHGIERHRDMSEAEGSQGGITRVIVRYSDGRVLNFVADARRPAFSEDDLLELKKVISRAASTAEWADINTRLGF
ncbi:MAG TPA: hypothetical protein VHH10_01015 [Rubrobacteraceae bacterium]|nr:hypothetical protein [Rubrobacteraceae bacterium]